MDEATAEGTTGTVRHAGVESDDEVAGIIGV
jgi:hypothetical protein